MAPSDSIRASLGADGRNTGALSFTSSGSARPSDAPVEQKSRIPALRWTFLAARARAPHAFGVIILAEHMRRRGASPAAKRHFSPRGWSIPGAPGAISRLAPLYSIARRRDQVAVAVCSGRVSWRL